MTATHTARRSPRTEPPRRAMPGAADGLAVREYRFRAPSSRSSVQSRNPIMLPSPSSRAGSAQIGRRCCCALGTMRSDAAARAGVRAWKGKGPARPLPALFRSRVAELTDRFDAGPCALSAEPRLRRRGGQFSDGIRVAISRASRSACGDSGCPSCAIVSRSRSRSCAKPTRTATPPG